MSVLVENSKFWLVPDKYLSASCHYTSGPSHSTDKLLTVSGYYLKELSAGVKQMTESGIMFMYKKYTDYILEAKYDRVLELKDYENNLPVPFNIADESILSIVLGLVALLIIAYVIFVGEVLIGKHGAGIVTSLQKNIVHRHNFDLKWNFVKLRVRFRNSYHRITRRLRLETD